MKKFLIIGIILLVCCLGLVVYHEIDRHNMVNIHDITNSGTVIEGKKAYLDATFIGGMISNPKGLFYVIFGDDVQYLVMVDYKNVAKVESYLMNNPEATYRFEGVTKKIPTDLEENGINFINHWLDRNHNDEGEENHTHNANVDDFYHYFGYVYLDTEVSDTAIKIITYVTGILGALSVLYFVVKKYHLL